MNLKKEWINLMDTLGLKRHEDLFEEIALLYGEPHRHYHTFDHIQACVRWWCQLKEYIVDPSNVLLAIFYHDVVYNVYQFTNEHRSVELFSLHAATMALSEDRIHQVSKMILATQYHVSEDLDTQLLLDIDLAILGADQEVYDQFEKHIRTEYAWVSEKLYRRKRRDVLQAFLSRERIYQTCYMRTRLEMQARKNLLRTIHHMTS